MGLLGKLRGEFVDVVEWIDDTNRTLVWRFPRYHNQIKHGARVIKICATALVEPKKAG